MSKKTSAARREQERAEREERERLERLFWPHVKRIDDSEVEKRERESAKGMLR